MYKVFINWNGCTNQLDFDINNLDEAVYLAKGEMKKWGKSWGNATSYIFNNDGLLKVMSEFGEESPSEYFGRINEV